MATYWVSKSLGSDTNNGLTEGAPFQTIAKALTTYAGFTNGDTINIMNGTYSERMIIPRLGEAGNFVIIQNAPGHAPILDGTGLGNGFSLSGNCAIYAQNLVKNSVQDLGYLKIRGLEIQNFTAGGIHYVGEGREIYIDGNYIHDQGATSSNAQHSILVGGQTYDGVYHYWTLIGVYVRNNTLTNVDNSVQPPAFSGVEALTLAWNISKFHVYNNTITNASFIGIDILGYDVSHITQSSAIHETGSVLHPHEGVVEYNTILDCLGEAGATSAYYSDGGQEVLWQHNYCDDMGGPGFALNAEDVDHTVTRHLVRSNVIRDTNRNYIQGGYNPFGLLTHTSSRWAHNVSHQDKAGAITGECFTNGKATTVRSRNNIGYITAAQVTWHRVNSYGITAAGTQDHDENVYFPESASPAYYFQFNGSTLTTALATYQSSSGKDANSVATDPAFINPNGGDYNLSGGSALINAGAPLTLTNGTGTASVTVIVDDALWFCDGYGVIAGDVITIGANSPVQIVAIDDATNTLTISSALTWGDGEAVNYAAVSGTVDMGLFEFGSFTPPTANPPVNIVPGVFNVVVGTPTILTGVSTGDLDEDIVSVAYDGGANVSVRVGSLGPPPAGVGLDI